MAGLAGFLNLDARPADASLLTRLLDGLIDRAPDGSAGVVSGPAALGFASFITVPHHEADIGPLTNPASGLTITFDGRIDNRHELHEALDGEVLGATDGALALAAFERWGRDAFVRLLGDFALAIWDSRHQELWLARDIYGVRPLYYRRRDEVLMWASDLQTHVRWKSADINEGFIAEILADRVRQRSETIYDGIFRLPPAHVGLMTAAGQWSTGRYWMPDPERTVRYRDEREYGEHFRSVLSEALRARTRSPNGAVGLFFSGGVDSTILAIELAKCPPARPLLLTMCAEGTDANEGPVARAVATDLALPQTALPVYRATRADYEDDARRSLDLPAIAMLSIGRPLEREIHQRAMRITLSGYGHEEWFFGNQLVAADHLGAGDFIGFVRAIARLARLPLGVSPSRGVALACWLQLSESMRRRVRRVSRRTVIPPWIDDRLAQRASLSDRLRNEVETPSFRSNAKALTWQAAMSGHQMLWIEHEERVTSSAGIDQRMPFYDRRLVELGLAIPEDVLFRDDQPRRVAFLAYPAQLGRLRGRVEGHDFSFMVAESVVSHGQSMLDEILEGPVGAWVQHDRARQMWRVAEGAIGNPSAHVGGTAWPLTHMMLVHFWLRAIDTLRLGRSEHSVSTAVH